jgi:predicted transposase/invertase (TIGR01784 family)
MDNHKSIHLPHDKAFRALMEYREFSAAFFRYHLPGKLASAFDPGSLKLLKETHLDKALRKTMNDLVFSCQLQGRPAYLTLLVEHQSTPDPMIAFRIHHYLFSVLYSHWKQHPGEALPPVYTLLFYHGVETPYPCSLNLLDCFNDPLNIMQDVLFQPVPIVDVGQIPDEDLKQQAWVGALSMAMKYIRAADMTPFALDVLKILPDPDTPAAKEMLQQLLAYVLSSGNIDDIDGFIEASAELPGPVRSEIVSFAEKIEARGEARGRAEGKAEGIAKGKAEGIAEGEVKGQTRIALNLLKEGAEPAFVAKVTGLPVEEVGRLLASVKS